MALSKTVRIIICLMTTAFYFEISNFNKYIKNYSYFAMKNMDSETVIPETTIRSQTVDESGDKKAKRSTDFFGDLT